MDLVQALNLLATVITIVGASVAIIRAVRKPSQRQPRVPVASYPQPTPYPSLDSRPAPYPSAPGGYKIVRYGFPGNSSAIGLYYGLALGTASFVLTALGGSTITSMNLSGGILTTLFWVPIFTLYIVAGFLPASRTGKVKSGLIAGGCVSVGFVGALPLFSVLSRIAYGVVFTLVLSSIPALVGRRIYKRQHPWG